MIQETTPSELVKTIIKGFILLKEHYDVHRWHPPLVYGRRGDADVGEGISLARVTIDYKGNFKKTKWEESVPVNHL